MSSRKVASLSLFAIFVLLASLIPGGPIENRDFSDLSPPVVWLYNGLLTFLGFGSLVLIYFMLSGRKFAFRLGMGVSFAWLILTLLDLFQIFPTSPTPMSPLLLLIEVLILILSVVALSSCYIAIKTTTEPDSKLATTDKKVWLAVGIIILLLGTGVLIYASVSVMSPDR